MRPIVLTLTTLALAAPLGVARAVAEDIVLPSRVASATVFPSGATVERTAAFDIPQGRHRLILTDMPVDDMGGLRIAAQGITLGSVTIRTDLTPPRTDETRAAIAAAEDTVDRLEDEAAAARDAARAIRAEAEAARARIEFLKSIARAEGASADVDQLRDLARMVGEETLAAERQALEAEARARQADRVVEEREEDLKDARRALAALDTEDAERAYLAVTVDAAQAAQGDLTLSYVTGAAQWRPIYDVHLDRAAPSMTLGRGAYVSQWTGEDWTDVALTLSTVRPSGQTEPGTLWPLPRRIDDPDAPPPPMPLAKRGMAMTEMAADMAAPVMEETAIASFDGLNVTYRYDAPVSLATGADELRIALGEVVVEPEIRAQAVPLLDQTAYLMARFTNDAGELVLPSQESEFYLDGTFVGLRPTPLIADGDEAEFSFGPIEGLRLERRVLDRGEGDRGVISRSNEAREEVRIEIRNLTGESWDLRLIDRVPYSEQDDLRIEWDANPAPTEQDLDGERGILAWDMTLPAGTTREVGLSTVLRWPTDKVLR